MSEPRKAAVFYGVTAAVLVALAASEGYRGEAYIPVKGDVPTIGYGSTKNVKIGDKTDPVRALIRLNKEVDDVFAKGIKNCITAPLYQYEFDAYLLLAYNVGVTAVCRKALPNQPPNLIDLINAERYSEACERIKAFNRGPSPGKDKDGKKIPGPILKGLVTRRQKESDMCKGKFEQESL